LAASVAVARATYWAGRGDGALPISTTSSLSAKYESSETEPFYRAQSRTVRQFCAQHGIDCALHW